MSSTQQHSDELRSSFMIDGSDTILKNRKSATILSSETEDVNSTQHNGNATIVKNVHENTKNTKNARPTAVFMKLKTYLLALRPWSLSASLVPTLLGSALAYRSSTPHEFNLLTFIFTVFTVVTVHGAGIFRYPLSSISCCDCTNILEIYAE